MKVLITTFLFICSLTAHAHMTKLAVITSEFDKDVMDFYLITNEKNNIDSIRYIQTTPEGRVFDDVTVPVEEVMKPEGVVIVERNGYNAVILQVEKFNEGHGGIVKLNYLYNGVTQTRHLKRMNLEKRLGNFSLFDLEKNPVNRLFLTVNYIRVVGIVGVRNIIMDFNIDSEGL